MSGAGRRKTRQAGILVAVAFGLPFLLFSLVIRNAWAGQSPDLLHEATLLFDEGRTDQAIERMREFIKQNPSDAEARDKLGYMLLEKGLCDEALDVFHAALSIKPSLRTSRTGVGFALLEKGDAKGAEVALKEALTLNPYPSMTHYALGLVYEKMGDYTKALAEYKESVKTYKKGKK